MKGDYIIHWLSLPHKFTIPSPFLSRIFLAVAADDLTAVRRRKRDWKSPREKTTSRYVRTAFCENAVCICIVNMTANERVPPGYRV